MQYAQLYSDSFQKPSKWLVGLKNIKKWTNKGLSDRVAMLGEWPESQYEYLCRYVHVDVWSSIDEYLIKDPDSHGKIMLDWGVQFMIETIIVVYENEPSLNVYKDKVTSLRAFIEQYAATT